MVSGQSNGRKNEALEQAIKDSGKHPSEIVAGITTERTLARYVNREVKSYNPFITRQIARRLKKSHAELFGG